MSAFYREHNGAIELFVRLTPRAAADRIGTVETTADGRAYLTTKVRAVPEKGAANAALERLVADHFGLGRSKVSVVAGHTARLKTLRIEADLVSFRERWTELAKPLIS